MIDSLGGTSSGMITGSDDRQSRGGNIISQCRPTVVPLTRANNIDKVVLPPQSEVYAAMRIKTH